MEKLGNRRKRTPKTAASGIYGDARHRFGEFTFLNHTTNMPHGGMPKEGGRVLDAATAAEQDFLA